MPASAITTSLPRPRSVSGIPRERAKRTIARSSWTLWTVANRSAGPPTRIVVNRASGSSREVLTPIRRWIAVPTRAGRRRPAPDPADPSRGRAPRDRLDRRRPAAAAGASARARRSAATASAAPGRPRPRAAAAIAVRAGIVEEEVRRRDERVGVERLVGDEPGGAGVGEDRGVRALVAAPACGYGTMTDGIPSAVTSASVDEPARPTTRSVATSAASMSSRRNGNGR